MRQKRERPTIGAGSMADIAFLLLIFFLVSTTILDEKAIQVILPEYVEASIPGPTNKKILHILINQENELMIEGEMTDNSLLKDRVIYHVSNPDKLAHMASSPAKAVISIAHDDYTSYQQYIKVYSIVKEAYVEMWTKEAKDRFDKSLAALSIEEKNTIKELIPLHISDLERQ